MAAVEVERSGDNKRVRVNYDEQLVDVITWLYTQIRWSAIVLAAIGCTTLTIVASFRVYREKFTHLEWYVSGAVAMLMIMGACILSDNPPPRNSPKP